MSSEAINLKIHSQFSICEGAVKINQLSEFCKKNNISAVGICDNENLSGALEFSNELSKFGIQPIIGTNIFLKEIVDNEIFYGKISLFAKNNRDIKIYSNYRLNLILILKMMTLNQIFLSIYLKNIQMGLLFYWW